MQKLLIIVLLCGIEFGVVLAVTVPSGITAYVPITLTNSQSSAFVSNSQIEIPVNALAYQGYEASNLQNIEFFYGNGTIVPSWMEGNSVVSKSGTAQNSLSVSSSSTNVIFWVRIYPANSLLPASSSNIIYMGFAPIPRSLLSSTLTGEAPWLTGTYGQYDDGANVFGFYMNGGSVPTILDPGGIATYQGAAVGSSSDLSVAYDPTLGNVIKVTPVNTGENTYYFMNAPNLPANFVVSELFYTTGTGYDAWIGAVNGGTQDGYGAMPGDDDQTLLSLYIDSARTSLASTGYTYPYGQWISAGLVRGPSGSLEAYSTNGVELLPGGNTVSYSDTTYATFNMVFFAPWVSGTYSRLMGMVVGHTNPPSNQMPSAAFGSVVPNVDRIFFPVNSAGYDAGQTLIMSAIGTGIAPYTYNYIISNTATDAVLYSYSVTNSLTENVVSITIPSYLAGNMVQANVVVTDSNQISTNSTYSSSSFVVSEALQSNALVVSSPTVERGSYDTLTQLGGTAPYTYNIIISNSINGNVIVSTLTSNVTSSGLSVLIPDTNANAIGPLTVNGFVNDSSGVQQSGAEFNGLKYYSNIILNNPTSFNVLSAFSISGWIYFNQINSGVEQNIFTKNAGSSWSSGGLQFYVYNQFKVNVYNEGSIHDSNTITNDVWYQFVLTYTPSTGNFILYIDGVQHMNANQQTESASNQYVLLGAQAGNTAPLNGILANFQFYNATLTAVQANELYQEGMGGVPILPSNIVSWLPLSGNANDYSGNGNGGAVTNIIYSSNIISTGYFGQANVFSSNTITATGITGCGTAPQGVVACIPENIINYQNAATSNDFQLEISGISANLIAGNVIVYNGLSGSVLPTWVESSNTLWVNLEANTIPAYTTVNGMLYIGFGTSGTNFFVYGNDIGEASELSPVYGEYDDIANVMNPGLLYQIYYTPTTCDSTSFQSNVVAAALGNGITINSCSPNEPFNSVTPPFNSPVVGTTQNVDGNTEGNVILNYQEGYSGGAAYPDPPVMNNAYSWIVKAIGWIDMPKPAVFSVTTDDGTAASYAQWGSGTNNGIYWLSTSPLNNLISSWKNQGASIYSSSLVSTGTYRLEYDYFENGGQAYTSLWSSNAVYYYSPTYPPGQLETAPSISISASTNTIDAGQSVTFTNTTSGGTAPYTFTYEVFDYGNVAYTGKSGNYIQTGNSIELRYPGPYNVLEEVTDSYGVVGYSANIPITVNSVPSISITPSSTSLNYATSDNVITISNTVSGGTAPYVSYELDVFEFGSSVAGAANVVIGSNMITFNSAGSYNVSESVTDSVGATELSANSVISVSSGSSPTTTTGCGGICGSGGSGVAGQPTTLPTTSTITVDTTTTVATTTSIATTTIPTTIYTTTIPKPPIEVTVKPAGETTPQLCNDLATGYNVTYESLNATFQVSPGISGCFNMSAVNVTTYDANATNSVKKLIMAINFSVSNASVSVQSIMHYPCSVPSTNVAPFILRNGTWSGITPFTADAASCTVSFEVPPDPVIALFYTSYTNSQTTTSTTSVPQVQTQQGGPWQAIILVVVVALLILLAYFLGTRRKRRLFR